ncbi:hypothetical protein DCC85_04275 [Paenibacillus sp. CAA11]|uniref:DUF6171 family protein n=1 Tax=Paenibacillus sp. CAA11 TaxID=1532905 RepID=UPI000D38DACC|nr:DUF6171 family protein [Paenibacillus sp. CAA11]AWB43515.1 hypothetical protein DCC85_04275 [Paenibacillus sp. CAA11]
MGTRSEARPCKGCERDITVTDQQISRMVDRMRLNFECVNEENYRVRLSACQSCSSLMEGHTCAVCGCIVQVRALLADQDCPNAQGSRWA